MEKEGWKMNKIHCANCGSSNITFEREASATIGRNKTSYKIKRRQNIIIRLSLFPLKFIFELIKIGMTGGLSLFFRRKNKVGSSKTTVFNKTLYKTVAVCQNCGSNWKVK
jgi:ribosomal protein S27E